MEDGRFCWLTYQENCGYSYPDKLILSVHTHTSLRIKQLPTKRWKAAFMQPT